MTAAIADPAAIAADVLAVLDGRGRIAPFAARIPGFDIAVAYAVTAELRALRVARGEKPVGRKIGFTNRNIWAEYAVHQPIWGDVYDRTVQFAGQGARIETGHLPEPRIEPEIVLGVGRDILAGMTVEEMAASIEWVAHGFEIVQSIFPGWKFAAADCVADGGLHGALHIGERRYLAPGEGAGLAAALASLSIALSRNGEEVDTGVGANVLDGPVHALRHLAGVLAGDALNPPVRKGELVTTGTLTRAFPIVPGERWATELSGYPLPGLSVEIA